jgi:hypothetical protein
MMKIAGSGSISQKHGSADPDPDQNVTDPQHCFFQPGQEDTIFENNVFSNLKAIIPALITMTHRLYIVLCWKALHKVPIRVGFGPKRFCSLIYILNTELERFGVFNCTSKWKEECYAICP